jgi:hypothetical protein
MVAVVAVAVSRDELWWGLDGRRVANVHFHPGGVKAVR